MPAGKLHNHTNIGNRALDIPDVDNATEPLHFIIMTIGGWVAKLPKRTAVLNFQLDKAHPTCNNLELDAESLRKLDT